MKLASEWLCHSYTSDYGVDAAAVRFGGVFGPWHGVPGGGPSKLLKSLIECAFTGVPYQIAAPDLDRQGMDYTYSPDGAQAIVRAAYAERVPNRVYNATMGQLHTIREIIEVIEKVSDRPLNVEVVDQDSMTKYGNPTSEMDLSRSVEEIGYKVEYPMDKAVADYLQWLERTSAAAMSRPLSVPATRVRASRSLHGDERGDRDVRDSGGELGRRGEQLACERSPE